MLKFCYIVSIVLLIKSWDGVPQNTLWESVIVCFHVPRELGFENFQTMSISL